MPRAGRAVIFETGDQNPGGKGANENMKEQIRQSLIAQIARMGYPEEFGIVLADELKTENAMARMLSYLIRCHPSSAEEIADEMLAIREINAAWQRKKINEYCTMKYNEWMSSEHPEDEDC